MCQCTFEKLRIFRLAAFVLALGIGVSGLSAASNEKSSRQAFLEQHCVACHSGDGAEAGLDLTNNIADLSQPKLLEQAIKVYDRVRNAEMPPATEPKPSASELKAFLEVLSRQLIEEEQRSAGSNGRTVLRRLNRIEYENTLRALLGVEVNVQDILPPDTPSHGFDNVADGLRFSQLQIEKYLEAADVALDAAIDLTELPNRFAKRMSLKDEKFVRENLDTPEGAIKDPASQEKHRVLFRELPDAVVMFNSGYPPVDFREFNAPATGYYRIRASAYAYHTEGTPATLRIYAHRFREKRLLGFFEMPSEPREVEVTARLERNELVQVVPHGVGFDKNGKVIWNLTADTFEGSGLAVQWVEIEGPIGDWPPPSVKTLYPNIPIQEIHWEKRRWREAGTLAWELAPKNAEQEIPAVVQQFCARAFRRPLDAGEAEPFIRLAMNSLKSGQSFEQSTRVAFRAILTSPQFLFLDEQEGKLSEHAIANRLSYFLWSGPPDEELLRLASEGKLTQPDVLCAQIERLLSSPRSCEFVKNFAGQWLGLRSIKATSPDKQLYPEFDEMLETSMVAESESFFSELLKSDLSVDNVVHSNFVMLNRTMASHYGIDGVNGEQFQRVALPEDSPRGGVMTQAAILKITANGTVTSPVTRGAWVMKRLLGKPPQPPPPNVGSVEPDTRGATTIRELLDKHRNSETCAKCHSNIDPPGFALESFDVIGGWRDRYRSLGAGDQPRWKFEGRDISEYKLGPAVDSSGRLPDGRRFESVAQFKQLLLDERQQVLRSLTENLLTYATGSGIRFSDRAEVERIVDQVHSKGDGLRSLVHEIIQSKLFQSK